MKRYTLKIEFGTPGHKEFVKENVLVDMELQGYDIDSIIGSFGEEVFQQLCHKKVGESSTFGIFRVIGYATRETLKHVAEQAEEETDVTFYECTDHDGHTDYFLRVRVTTQGKEEMIRNFNLKEIPKTWWRFGLATHNLDKLIIQDDELWYHMFGHFYFNTGKRK